MAEQGVGSKCEYRRQPPAPWGQFPVAHRVDPVVQPVETPSLEAAFYFAKAETCLAQLPTSNHAVLASRERRNSLFPPRAPHPPSISRGAYLTFSTHTVG